MTLGKTSHLAALVAVAAFLGFSREARAAGRAKKPQARLASSVNLSELANIKARGGEELHETKDIHAHVVSSPKKVGDRLTLEDTFAGSGRDAYDHFVRRLHKGETAKLEHTVLTDETMMLKLTDGSGRGITQFDKIDKSGGQAVELGTFDVREYSVSKAEIVRDGAYMKRLGPKWAAAYQSFASDLATGEKVNLEIGTSKASAHGKKMYLRVTRTSGASITQLSDFDPKGTVARQREVFETGPFSAAVPAPTVGPPQ